MRDHRERMLKFLGNSRVFHRVTVDTIEGELRFPMSWLTNEQLSECTRQCIANWRVTREINRENRSRRHA